MMRIDIQIIKTPIVNYNVPIAVVIRETRWIPPLKTNITKRRGEKRETNTQTRTQGEKKKRRETTRAIRKEEKIRERMSQTIEWRKQKGRLDVEKGEKDMLEGEDKY